MTNVVSILENALDAEQPDDGPGDVTGRLLNAAVIEFSNHGFEAARVSDIARRSGLTTGAIYSRWKDKREVFMAAVGHVMANRLSRDTSGQGRLDRIASSLGADWLRDAVDSDACGLLLEAYVVARRDESLQADMAHLHQAETSDLAKMVIKGKELGIIDNALPTEHVVLCFLALRVGLMLVSVQPDARVTTDVEQWDEMMKRLVNSWSPPKQN